MIINESGNTNVNMTSDENIGTGQSISFSELDSNTGNPRLQEPKSGQVEDSKEHSNIKTLDSKPVSNEKDDLPTENVQKVPESSKNGKKFTFSNGDQTGELDAEAKFKHKVDGKETEWTLLELLNDKSGQTAWDKKFQELSVEKNTFKKERDVIEKYIGGFQEIAKKGDSLGAMEYLAQMAGISPLEFKKNLRTQVLPEFEKWQQMSEEARKFKEIEDENNYFKQQRESESQKVQGQEAQKALDSKLKAAQEAHGFSDIDIVDAFDVLAEHYPKDKIDINLLTEYMKERNAVTKAESLISKIDTELLQNEKVLDSIADMIIKGRHSDEEISDIILSSFAKKSSKTKSKSTPVVDKKPEPITTKKQALTWADLD